MLDRGRRGGFLQEDARNVGIDVDLGSVHDHVGADLVGSRYLADVIAHDPGIEEEVTQELRPDEASFHWFHSICTVTHAFERR
jgi:hypothetical protein